MNPAKQLPLPGTPTAGRISTPQALEIVARVHPKYRPAWDGRSPREQTALALYFLPQRSRKPLLGPTRPRVLKWYCPFADQSVFPSGHRYCINVYTGCSHNCAYCYAAAYEPSRPSPKKHFARHLAKDMDDLERFNVPPAPVHVSNSTDPLQPVEAVTGHTRAALEHILAHRHRFTTVTVLTKNPSLLVTHEYTPLLQSLLELPRGHPRREQFTERGLPGLRVEVSLAFRREPARQALEPGVPTIADRIAGIRALRAAGIPVVLRIDPLFPRWPQHGGCPSSPRSSLLMNAQTLDDLDLLVQLARESGAAHVVYSALKIVQPRGRPLSDAMQTMRRIFERLAQPQKPQFRGGAWRLPEEVAHDRIIRPFLTICRAHGVVAKHCMQNLLETP